VAWALSTSPKEIFTVSDWDTDEANNHDLEKVPSVVTYDSQGMVNSWGFSLEERRHHISWFKMGLCEEAIKMLAKERPERFEKLHNLLTKYQKKPIDVSADYLRLLWAHAMENIQARVDPVLWEDIKLRIVLTVPAIWDHKAQDLTRQAAKMAGMLDRKGSTLELIGEPEAAAFAVFTGMNTSRTQSSLKVCQI
jgi:molecular chaperone DnaK (HSP70)